jgi:division protein CdvB (Snf7/Vps24/ESCRT-III family)
MRATINFDLDVGDVEETMGSLASMQVTKLQMAIDELEAVSDKALREEISQAIELIDSASSQLQQYYSMLVSFEQAKFETLIPQPVEGDVAHTLGAVRESVNKMKQFDAFLERTSMDGTDDGDPQEG